MERQTTAKRTPVSNAGCRLRTTLFLFTAIFVLCTLGGGGYLAYKRVIQQKDSHNAERIFKTDTASSQTSFLSNQTVPLIPQSSGLNTTTTRILSCIEATKFEPVTKPSQTPDISTEPSSTKSTFISPTEQTTRIDETPSRLPPTLSTTTESPSSSPIKSTLLIPTKQTTANDKTTSSTLLQSIPAETDEIPVDFPISYPDPCLNLTSDLCYNKGAENDNMPDNCECDANETWTVIQKRFDGSVDFYRNWTEYKEGFGDANREYWLGNELVHQMTSNANYTLKVVLKDWDSVTKYAIYETFKIANEADGYRLAIGGYAGDAGDAMTYHNGRKFTTRDRDNDPSPTTNCAVRWTGAWWYNQCYRANLNGQYQFGPINNRLIAGIFWVDWHSGYYSLKQTKMMIKTST